MDLDFDQFDYTAHAIGPSTFYDPSDGQTNCYYGGLKNGIPHGYGRLAYRDGLVYEGEWLGGNVIGRGVLISPGGTRCEGGFVGFGRLEGYGAMTSPEGTRYEGEYRNGYMEGSGVIKYPDGRSLLGEFRRGKPNGICLAENKRGGLHAIILSFEQGAFLRVVRRSKLSDNSPTECSICMGAFADSDDVIVRTKCNHVFHAGCSITWLRDNGTCPLCREQILSLPDEDDDDDDDDDDE